MKRKVFVVVNPYAGGNTGRTQWPHVAAELQKRLGDFSFEMSTSIGHAECLAAEARANGYDLVVAYGGDGTVSEVVNGLFEKKDSARLDTSHLDAASRPTLGIIGVGTGMDFIKTLGIPADIDQQIHILATRKARKIDVGRISFQSMGGPKTRLFVNIASAGLSAEVIKRVGRFRTLLGKKLAYLGATLDSRRAWKPRPITVKMSQKAETKKPLVFPEKPLAVVVANGRYFGGGMPIAARADLADGCLDLIVIPDFAFYKIPYSLMKLYQKLFHRVSGVVTERVSSVILKAENASVGVEIDGEALGTLPAEMDILPQALNVIF